MQPTSPTVSVVVPTRGRRERLPKLLDALALEPASEIIIVVNGAPDDSLELLEELATEEKRLKPRFSSGDQTTALQLGAEEASSEVVLMLDDDVVPAPGLVEGHARRHAAGAGLVVVGYMPVHPPSPRRPGQWPIHLYTRSYEKVCEEYERNPGRILEGLWGGNVSLRRSDLLRVGFKPSTEMPVDYWYHRDRDFGLRCMAAGLEGVFDRSLLATHEHQSTSDDFMRVSRDSGHTRWASHAAHTNTIGPLPPYFYERVVRAPARPFVRLSRHEAARVPIQSMLRALVAMAGRLRLFRIESHAGFVLGVIEQQRGSLEAAATTDRSTGT